MFSTCNSSKLTSISLYPSECSRYVSIDNSRIKTQIIETIYGLNSPLNFYMLYNVEVCSFVPLLGSTGRMKCTLQHYYSHRDRIISVFKGEKKDGIVIVILRRAVVAQVVIHFLLTLVCC